MPDMKSPMTDMRSTMEDMKRYILSILALCLCTLASAQNDSRMPGLYYVDGENSVVLTHITGGTQTIGAVGSLVELGQQVKSYKGTTSDTPCKKAEFVLVIDPEKKGATQTLKKYDPFIKSMSPELMLLLPLKVDKKNRIFDDDRTIAGLKTKKEDLVPFEYEKLTDNSWKITAQLPAGEYAWAFKIGKLGAFNLDAVFDFTME